MPTYDYYCKACGHQAEVIHKITEPTLTTCPQCKQETLVRRPGGGGFLLKGDGFYATMYGNNDTPKENSGGCCPCGKNKTSCSSEP